MEAVELFSDLYSRSRRGEGLLRQLQLWDKRHAYYSQLSGGQKQRLAVALALVNDPQVVFLDEPTAGLDPQARHEIHRLVGELRGQDRTILLTTHYIEEADRLSDRVAIIDQGRIIAMGTPGELRGRTAGYSVIEIQSEDPLPPAEAGRFEGAENLVLGHDRRTLTAHSKRPARTLVELVKWLDQEGVEPTDVHLKRPSLEDVYIEMTGRELRD